MINKKNILTLAAAMCLACTSANASSLVKMDIKKTSENAVDITFYTTAVTGNPMPTRKSNNKYVILMPDVAGKNAGTPDLSAVKDMITDVDIKNVDDGMGGYTKVTLITTKPINIKTHSEKTAPLTQEEKDAKNVIAQVKTHPQQTAAPAESKAESVKTTVTSSAAAPAAQSAAPQKAAQEAKQPVKTAINTANTATQDKTTAKTPSKPVIEPKAEEQVKEQAQEQVYVAEDNELDIKEVEKIEKISKSQPAKKKSNGGWALLVFPLLLLYLLARVIKNSIQNSAGLKASFKEHLEESPRKQGNYDDIINNSDLNWQERYQKFLEESKGEVKTRKYSFIPNTITETDKKRLEFENTLTKTPEIYEPQEIDISQDVVSEVKSEDEAIQKEMSTIKLKAFAKPASLHTSDRKRLKKTIATNPAAKEGKFVKLNETALNASTRKFEGANLKVLDLISAGSRYLEDTDRDTATVEKQQNYTMSSIDEYFDLLDKEQAKSGLTPDLSSKVAASLAQVKPSMNMRKSSHISAPDAALNPFAGRKRSGERPNGLVVKSGYNIDDSKGFYLVSLDGVSALVGRINEEIFVLKKFDDNVDELQVRLDSPNVYMVKAGDFKSLVDVDEKQMGVLIEL